jgi:hypothetical protein
MVLFHDEIVSGELDLIAFAHTAAGARFTTTWQTRSLLGSRHPGLPPFDQFTVTDDRGGDYGLRFSSAGRPELACDLSLHPEPPRDIRWLDVTAPGEPAIRVRLEQEVPGSPGSVQPEVSEVSLSVGEHLLNRIAEHLLEVAPDVTQDLWTQVAGVSSGRLAHRAVGLGEAVAALEAAEALPPLSPVPGRLAALCAGLGVSGHGITAPPARDLPAPWLSVLAHYQRRKPDTALAHYGFAAATAALPELDGIRLVLLGLHNGHRGTWLHALAIGQIPGTGDGPFGLDASFPLSVWVRDSGGRWHAAPPAARSPADGEHALTLRLVPPLARPTPWIEVLAAGQTAEVRARLPLRWGYPP